MTIDKDKLRALANSATKLVVDWRVSKDHNNVNVVIGDGGWNILSAWHTPDGKALANAEFAAAANPKTILALLDEIEALRKDAKRYRFLVGLPDEEAQQYLGFANHSVSDQEIDAAMAGEEVQ